jgi:uncharacterized phage protein (TIGR01671 family)
MKVRGYDVENERMLEPSELNIACSNGEIFFSDSSPPFNKHGKVELTESTGLRDKNGVEIYEGDIITGWKGSSEPSVVEVEPDGGFWYWNGEYGDESNFEVIGNIYEHPDLLSKDSGNRA